MNKPKVINNLDIMVRVYRGKFGEYRYRSPKYGYKRAHKYDKMVYIYIGSFEDGYLEILYFKHRTIKWIEDYIANTYRTESRAYIRAMKRSTNE